MADASLAGPAARGREAEQAAGFHSTEPGWLIEGRDRAKEIAATLELPGPKAKGWEFTDLSDFDFDAYTEAVAGVEGLSRSDGDGPVVLPLADAAASHPELVRERLGSIVPTTDPFAARNEARWRDGILVHVPAGVALSEPIRLTVNAAAGEEIEWRALIVLAEGAEAEIWERYASDGEGLFNGVVELSLGDGANLRYICEQELSPESWVFATQRAEVGREANLEWVALGFGSARGKVRMETKLAGRGSSARVTGAYAGDGVQHLDYDTTQEHAAQDTTSDLAFRGVLAERATAVWRGMIRVDPGAQRTDAFQESRNLLLSTDAHADAIPGLEIEADDVRCTHAAAIAQVDREQLHYLRAHGVSEDEAKRLVVEGFLQELVERAREGPIREALASELSKRLAELLD
ncbi:MAG: Fe-S cluster assembly protein SufD [Solirubrobacterales bacterium]|nr:Fe-S cluster assembly protein SufD [Solirubrobacterales bacterium]